MIQRQINIGPYILFGLILHALIVSFAPAVYISIVRDATTRAYQNAERNSREGAAQKKLFDEPLDRR